MPYCNYCKIHLSDQEWENHNNNLHNSTPRRFYCTINSCNASFSTKSNLNVHINKVHLEKKYKCKKCPSEFVGSAALAHHKSLFNKHPYQCRICCASYKTEDNLKLHFQEKHLSDSSAHNTTMERRPDKNEDDFFHDKTQTSIIADVDDDDDANNSGPAEFQTNSSSVRVSGTFRNSQPNNQLKRRNRPDNPKDLGGKKAKKAEGENETHISSAEQNSSTIDLLAETVSLDVNREGSNSDVSNCNEIEYRNEANVTSTGTSPATPNHTTTKDPVERSIINQMKSGNETEMVSDSLSPPTTTLLQIQIVSGLTGKEKEKSSEKQVDNPMQNDDAVDDIAKSNKKGNEIDFQFASSSAFQQLHRFYKGKTALFDFVLKLWRIPLTHSELTEVCKDTNRVYKFLLGESLDGSHEQLDSLLADLKLIPFGNYLSSLALALFIKQLSAVESIDFYKKLVGGSPIVCTVKRIIFQLVLLKVLEELPSLNRNDECIPDEIEDKVDTSIIRKLLIDNECAEAKTLISFSIVKAKEELVCLMNRMVPAIPTPVNFMDTYFKDTSPPLLESLLFQAQNHCLETAECFSIDVDGSPFTLSFHQQLLPNNDKPEMEETEIIKVSYADVESFLTLLYFPSCRSDEKENLNVKVSEISMKVGIRNRWSFMYGEMSFADMTTDAGKLNYFRVAVKEKKVGVVADVAKNWEKLAAEEKLEFLFSLAADEVVALLQKTSSSQFKLYSLCVKWAKEDVKKNITNSGGRGCITALEAFNCVRDVISVVRLLETSNVDEVNLVINEKFISKKEIRDGYKQIQNSA